MASLTLERAHHHAAAHRAGISARAAHLQRLSDPSRISARTVIVSGDLDPLTPAAHSRDLAAAIPGAHHINVADAGHMLPQQAPDVIHRAITAAVSAQSQHARQLTT